MLAQSSTFFWGLEGLASAPLLTTPGDYLFAPAFNDAYFSNATSTNWAIFSCGYDTSGSFTILYDIGFYPQARLLKLGTPAKPRISFSSP